MKSSKNVAAPMGCNASHLLVFVVNNQSPTLSPVVLVSVDAKTGNALLHASFPQAKTLQFVNGDVTYNAAGTRAYTMFSTLGPPYSGVLYFHDLAQNISRALSWKAPVPEQFILSVYESPVVVNDSTLAVLFLAAQGPQCPQSQCIFSTSLCLWDLESNQISAPLTPLRIQKGYMSSVGALWLNSSYVHIVNPDNTALYGFETISAHRGFLEGPMLFGREGSAPYTFLSL
jgi:hypothetical protein